MSDKEQLLHGWAFEFGTTTRVLGAYPPERAAFRPHERSSSAKEIVWTIVRTHEALTEYVLSGEEDFTPQPSPPPEEWSAVLDRLHESHRTFTDALRASSDELLFSTIRVRTHDGYATPLRLQFIQMCLMDMVHHRGQFSVYLRMAGGKVPSIYGPSADEPFPPL